MWNIYPQCLKFLPHNLFLIKLLSLGILFSTVVRAAVVAKLVILGTLSLISLTFSL